MRHGVLAMFVMSLLLGSAARSDAGDPTPISLQPMPTGDPQTNGFFAWNGDSLSGPTDQFSYNTCVPVAERVWEVEIPEFDRYDPATSTLTVSVEWEMGYAPQADGLFLGIGGTAGFTASPPSYYDYSYDTYTYVKSTTVPIPVASVADDIDEGGKIKVRGTYRDGDNTPHFGYTAGRPNVKLSVSFTPGIKLPRFTTPTLPSAHVGVPYSGNVDADDGVGSPVYSLLVPRPSWLSIDADTGQLSGTPQAAGTVTAIVQASNAATGKATRSYSIPVIGAPTFESTLLPIALVDRGYDVLPPITGGSGPAVVSVVGTLPPGLAVVGQRIKRTGLLEPGLWPFTLRVADSSGAHTEHLYSIVVAKRQPAVSRIATTTIGSGAAGALAFDLLSGSTLDVTLNVKLGGSALNPRLFRDDGTEIDISPFVARAGNRLRISGYAAESTRRFALVLEALDGDVSYSGTVKTKAARSATRTEGWGPGSTPVELAFGALKGSIVKLSALANGAGVPAPQIVTLYGPAGEIDVDALLRGVKGGFSVSSFKAPTSGNYVLRITPRLSGSATGTVTVRAAIAPPAGYSFTIAP